MRKCRWSGILNGERWDARIIYGFFWNKGSCSCSYSQRIILITVGRTGKSLSPASAIMRISILARDSMSNSLFALFSSIFWRVCRIVLKRKTPIAITIMDKICSFLVQFLWFFWSICTGSGSQVSDSLSPSSPLCFPDCIVEYHCSYQVSAKFYLHFLAFPEC